MIAPRKLAFELGNGMTAVDSCITAIYGALAFRYRDFDCLMAFLIKLHGDVDTIAAMAGAIWGATRGADALPQEDLDRLELYDRLLTLAQQLVDVVNFDLTKK